MASFYIVMQKKTAWGVGKTKEQAIQDAAQWVPIKEMEALMESCPVVQNGRGGFYLAPISFKAWDERLVELDGSALAKLAWDQQRHNYIANKNSHYREKKRNGYFIK